MRARRCHPPAATATPKGVWQWLAVEKMGRMPMAAAGRGMADGRVLAVLPALLLHWLLTGFLQLGIKSCAFLPQQLRLHEVEVEHPLDCVEQPLGLARFNVN